MTRGLNFAIGGTLHVLEIPYLVVMKGIETFLFRGSRRTELMASNRVPQSSRPAI